MPLETGWEFTFDTANAGLKADFRHGAWHETGPTSRSRTSFDPNPTDANFLGTIGWYRLKFDTPATPEGFTWSLRFEGVRRVARVWLNGR